MSSFPFNKLPIELQLLVWHHARASVGQVITGDLAYSTKTLTIHAHNIDRLKEYVKLLSICHISREEALRDRPIFLLEDTDLLFSTMLALGHLLPDLPESAKRSLAIKHWPFGYVFADILIELIELSMHTREAAPLAQRCAVVGELLVHFFGGGIRRLHLYGGDEWPTGRRSLSWRTDKPVHTTFCDANARRFLVPALDPDNSQLAELREVVRQDVHGETSQNVAHPITVNQNPHGPGYLADRDTLVNLVKHMRANLPDLEYISLLSLNVPTSVDKTSADKTSADKSAVDNTAFNDTADDNTAVDNTAVENNTA